jgi:hypothetical protein
MDCTSLTSITIPKNVTSIKSLAFIGCSGLMSIEAHPENTTYHSSGNCLIHTSYKQVVAGCDTSVIPDDGSVIQIGNSAFNGRSNLTRIVIPDTIRTIGASAFTSCTSLREVIVKAGTPPSLNSNSFSKVPNDCVFYVPADSVDKYKSATNWSARADYIFAIEE